MGGASREDDGEGPDDVIRRHAQMMRSQLLAMRKKSELEEGLRIVEEVVMQPARKQLSKMGSIYPTEDKYVTTKLTRTNTLLEHDLSGATDDRSLQRIDDPVDLTVNSSGQASTDRTFYRSSGLADLLSLTSVNPPPSVSTNVIQRVPCNQTQRSSKASIPDVQRQFGNVVFDSQDPISALQGDVGCSTLSRNPEEPAASFIALQAPESPPVGNTSVTSAYSGAGDKFAWWPGKRPAGSVETDSNDEGDEDEETSGDVSYNGDFDDCGGGGGGGGGDQRDDPDNVEDGYQEDEGNVSEKDYEQEEIDQRSRWRFRTRNGKGEIDRASRKVHTPGGQGANQTEGKKRPYPAAKSNLTGYENPKSGSDRASKRRRQWEEPHVDAADESRPTANSSLTAKVSPLEPSSPEPTTSIVGSDMTDGMEYRALPACQLDTTDVSPTDPKARSMMVECSPFSGRLEPSLSDQRDHLLAVADAAYTDEDPDSGTFLDRRWQNWTVQTFQKLLKSSNANPSKPLHRHMDNLNERVGTGIDEQDGFDAGQGETEERTAMQGLDHGTKDTGGRQGTLDQVPLVPSRQGNSSSDVPSPSAEGPTGGATQPSEQVIAAFTQGTERQPSARKTLRVRAVETHARAAVKLFDALFSARAFERVHQAIREMRHRPPIVIEDTNMPGGELTMDVALAHDKVVQAETLALENDMAYPTQLLNMARAIARARAEYMKGGDYRQAIDTECAVAEGKEEKRAKGFKNSARRRAQRHAKRLPEPQYAETQIRKVIAARKFEDREQPLKSKDVLAWLSVFRRRCSLAQKIVSIVEHCGEGALFMLALAPAWKSSLCELDQPATVLLAQSIVKQYPKARQAFDLLNKHVYSKLLDERSLGGYIRLEGVQDPIGPEYATNGGSNLVRLFELDDSGRAPATIDTLISDDDEGDLGEQRDGDDMEVDGDNDDTLHSKPAK